MNPYTFKKNIEGNVEVLENGQRISTGTESAASRYGYKPELVNQTTLSNANVIEKVIPDLKDRAKKLSETGQYSDEQGIPRYADGEQIPEPSIPTTLFNPITGESRTLQPAEKDTVKSLKEQGWEVGQENVYDKQQRELFDSLKSQLDASTKRQISAIEQQYSVRKAQQAEIDRRAKEGINQSLLLGGSSRYAQLSSTGIIQAKETASLLAISQLDAEEKELINATLAAQETGNYKLMEKKLEMAEKKRAEKQAETEKLSKAIADENTKLKETKRLLDIGDAVSVSLSGGLVGSNEIYQTLAKAGLDATPKEIKEAMESLTLGKKNEQDLKSDFGLFTYYKENNKLPPNIAKIENEGQQYASWINYMGLAKDGKLGQAGQVGGVASSSIKLGVGASTPIQEQLIRDRMFVQFQPLFNKGVLSESDRKIIDEKIARYREAGMSEGEILSIFAGLPSDVKTPYNKKLVEIATAITPTTDAHRELINKIGISLRNNNPTTAIRIVENSAIQRALDQKVINADSFVTEDDVRYIKNKTDDITKLLGEGWTNEVGAFTGNFNKWLSTKFGWNDARKVRAKLGSLTSDMINKRAGSALTETEWERLIEPNIPQFNESARSWASKLLELQDNALERYNSGRSVAVLPEVNFDQLDLNKRLELYKSSDIGESSYGSYNDLDNIPTSGGGYNPSVWSEI